jgi:farnesyl diphosphate synthase
MNMAGEPAFAAWMAAVQARTERALANLLPSAEIAPSRLHRAMRYAVLDGGKRVRPLLCHAAGELAGAAAERLDGAACAVELIHAYSLVHDDLPSMDNDVLRRGKPTCHVEFDEATALLAGDSLQALAFQVLCERPIVADARRQLDMVRMLAAAAGSRGMAGGQAIDLESVGKALAQEELEFMHIHKTGALIRAAVLLGARCGSGLDEPGIESLDKYAKCAGLLFQVIDDLLDCESDTATLGKTADKDRQQNKPTYVTVLGADRAHAFSRELLGEALAALEQFGTAARRLRELTDFIVTRRF